MPLGASVNCDCAFFRVKCRLEDPALISQPAVTQLRLTFALHTLGWHSFQDLCEARVRADCCHVFTI